MYQSLTLFIAYNFVLIFNRMFPNKYLHRMCWYLSNFKKKQRGPSVNPFPNKPWFLCVCSTSLLKYCGKRRNCSLRAISPFPTVFYTHLESFLLFSSNLKLSSAKSIRLEESKFYRLGKG